MSAVLSDCKSSDKKFASNEFPLLVHKLLQTKNPHCTTFLSLHPFISLLKDLFCLLLLLKSRDPPEKLTCDALEIHSERKITSAR